MVGKHIYFIKIKYIGITRLFSASNPVKSIIASHPKITSVDNNIAAAHEANMVRSGLVDTNTDWLKAAGVNGHYMSYSGADENRVYYLLLNATNSSPSRGPISRSTGFSLRCLQE